MLPYTVIKEANRPEHSGTATGVINFINFSLSALLGPIFASLLTRVSGGGEPTGSLHASLIRQFGLPIDSYGDPEGSPLADL